MKTPNLNTVAPYIPTPQEQIKNLRMHLSMPWKESVKIQARKELERLLMEYGEPEPEFQEFELKQLSLFEELKT
ncbi:hypothetical protein FNW02_35085 [Komarekiella sp. 'clone 1']|uniref:Uncharacterized protein n=1 Tax=Komarekiella delphini-convector SJRDD-AB1 TaxID=2593771 RepID=A0AA40T4L3_9NOST|nr:hypothetical protein [Komarekiella delphini-convector]MBD6620838.1 hypothetical protein [Komarekiella delphini-convector SJRDD-AB1]